MVFFLNFFFFLTAQRVATIYTAVVFFQDSSQPVPPFPQHVIWCWISESHLLISQERVGKAAKELGIIRASFPGPWQRLLFHLQQ